MKSQSATFMSKKHPQTFRLILVFHLVSLTGVTGQISYNHPELKWQSFETAHFQVHFHDGTERTAREGAFVAEAIYPHITELYQYEPPQKTHLIFLDTDDYSNGITYFYDNKIEIWASPMDLEFRGSHRWLQNVITHEFTHIVSIQKAMKFGGKIPAGYLQWIGYEKEKREDVLYGYPYTVVSYPVAGTTVPPWLAEGVAQYMYMGATYDFWDTHRDMILRDRVLNDKLLTLTEMSTFGKPGIGNESTYNAGFALVRYIVYKYGEDALRQITSGLSDPLKISVDSAIESATGVSAERLYIDFESTLIERYSILARELEETEVKGTVLVEDGTINIHPVWSPDGEHFAYLSNSNHDYISQTDLFIYSFDDGTSERIARGVLSSPDWKSTGDIIYYTKKSKHNRHGSRWFDLYEYSIEDEKETRITKGARAFSAVVLEGDSLIAYLAARDGTHNISLINLNTEESVQLTDFKDGRQVFSLAYDPGRNWLMFDYLQNHFRNTAYLGLSDTTFFDLVSIPEWDERDIVKGPGDTLIYASDKSGIFNLFMLNPANGQQGYITNVRGGAFMPDMDVKGRVLYSLYEDGRFRIALLDSLNLIDENRVGYDPDHFQKFNGLPPSITDVDSSQVMAYSDNFSPMFLFPKMMMDYGMPKLGLYFMNSEILNRLNVFGGVSANFVRDLDMFLLFELRTFYPTLYTDVFFLTRHISDRSKLMDVYGFDADIRYRLFQIESGAKFPVMGSNEIKFYGSYQNYRASSVWWVNQENLSGKSGVDYYVGQHFGLAWKTDVFRPTVDQDINPSNGYHFDLDIRHEKNRFFNANESLFQLIYDRSSFLRYSANGRIHATVPRTERWTVSGEISLGWMTETAVDSFFNFFAGGMPGLRGYPFYAIEGNRMAVASLMFRMPLVRQRHIAFGPFILQNVVVGSVVQMGDAWDGSQSEPVAKRSVGVQIRLGGFSFYNYPTGIGVEIHRGLDKFSFMNHRYGGELRTYFTLLFGF